MKANKLISFPLLVLFFSFNTSLTMEPEEPEPMQKSALERLPKELRILIVKALTEADATTPSFVSEEPETFFRTPEDLTPQEKLQWQSLKNAIKNIKQIAKVNKDFASIVKDPAVIDAIVTELANHYTNGNKLRVALVFGPNALKAAREYVDANKDKDFLQDLLYLSAEFAKAVGTNNIYVAQKLIQYFPEQIISDIFNDFLDSIIICNLKEERDKFFLIIQESPKFLKKLINEMHEALLRYPNERKVHTNIFLLALRYGDYDLVNFMLKQGADVNSIEKYESPYTFPETALMKAILKQDPALVRLILAYKPDIAVMVKNIKTGKNRSALSMAKRIKVAPEAEAKKQEIIKLLRDAGAQK